MNRIHFYSVYPWGDIIPWTKTGMNWLKKVNSKCRGLRTIPIPHIPNTLQLSFANGNLQWILFSYFHDYTDCLFVFWIWILCNVVFGDFTNSLMQYLFIIWQCSTWNYLLLIYSFRAQLINSLNLLKI